MATPKIALTAAKLKSLKPQSKEYEIRDAGAPGLRLRVYPSGTMVFRWIYKEALGKHRAKTIGSYPALSLAKARAELDELKEQHAEALANGERLEGENTVNTVDELAEIFYRRILKQTRKRPEEALDDIQRHILPTIGKRKLATLKTTTCRAVIEHVVDSGAPAHARKILGLLKQMLDFAVSRGDLRYNPAAPLRGKNLGVIENNPRTRTLSGEELRQFWEVLDQKSRMSVQIRYALKILALTGVRSGELRQARWENVDLNKGTWTIPVADQKLSLKQAAKAKPFVVPLVPMTATLFSELHDYTGNSPFVLATDSKQGFLSDQALCQAVRRMFELGRLNIERFNVHDLRRTLRTHLGETLRVPPHICERCLNHRLGTIIETYDTGDYLDERREALERLAEWLERQVHPQPNVVELVS